MIHVTGFKKLLAGPLLTALLMGMTGAGCAPAAGTDADAPRCEYVAAGEDITDQVKDLSEDAVLLESAGYRLTMDGNGVLKVVNAAGSVLWSTGVSSQETLQGIGESNAALSSAVLNYHINSESDQSFNSYADAYSKDQFRVYRDGGTIVYEQILGNFTGDMFLPEALTQERYDEITGRMTESDAQFISRQYTLYTPETATAAVLETVPNLKDQPFYVLMDADSYIRRLRLHETFEKAGYTSGDLESDRRAAGIDITDQGEVFKLVMRFTLEDGELVLDIPCNQIYYPASMPLVSIQLMKYGAYAPAGSEGAYIVPSGSGAMFTFQEGKQADYRLQYYGRDYSNTKAGENVDYSGHPFYGILNGTAGCVGIIEEGAENVRLCIETVQGGYVQYPEIQLMAYQTSSLGQTRQFYLHDEESYTGNIRIRYTFLEGGEATYSHIAARYGEYLEEIGAFTGKTVGEALPFQLEVINSLYVIKETAGISYTTEQAVTTFEQTQAMLQYFRDQGIDSPWLKLNGANKGGLFVQSPGSFTPSSKAGGRRGYEELREYCVQAGIPFYLQVNLPFYYADRLFDGYSSSRDTARQLNKEPTQLYYKEKSTLADREDLPVIQTVAPARYAQYAQEYAQQAAQLGAGLGLGEFVRVLNSDFSDDQHANRAQALEQVKESLALLQDSFALMAEDPGAYALAALDVLEKLPLESGGQAIWDRDIPLIPLAIHGRMAYTSVYWNDRLDSARTRLKAIEYGSGVAYRFAQDVTKELMETQNSFLFNVDFELRKETAVENYQYVAQALDGLSAVEMTEHRYLTDTLVRVAYENGTVIYINYGGEAAEAQGVTVPAMSYRRVG